jgi:hypothetical protein
MWFDVVLVIVGLVFLIAVMAFVLNPPEFWVKRAFHRKAVRGVSTEKTPKPGSNASR